MLALRESVRIIFRCTALLLVAYAINAQVPTADLPRGLSAAAADPALTKESATIVSIYANGEIYLGRTVTPKSQLGARVADSVRQSTDSNQIVYIAASASINYKAVVEILGIIREQELNRIGLVVNRTVSNDFQGTFLIELPMTRKEGEDISSLKPNPLTLVTSISHDLTLTLNHDSGPRRHQLCFQSVPNGVGADPSRLEKWLECLFLYRGRQHAYRIGMETRNDVPLVQRIEKTVFVRAPLSIKYNEVLRVINAIKGAGADPIGLQIDDLPE